MTSLTLFALVVALLGLVVIYALPNAPEGYLFIAVGACLKLVDYAIQRGWIVLLCLALVGCEGSPTAPTSVVRFAWAPASGCTPQMPIPQQIGLPIGGVRPLWIWQKDGKTFTYTMQREHGVYWVCSWSATEAK